MVGLALAARSQLPFGSCVDWYNALSATELTDIDKGLNCLSALVLIGTTWRTVGKIYPDGRSQLPFGSCVDWYQVYCDHMTLGFGESQLPFGSCVDWYVTNIIGIS